MGNRAVVIFTDGKEISPAVFLYWNGGPESIYAFLAEMDRRKIRHGDTMYESARFCHIICDLFDGEMAGGLSIGLTNGPETLTKSAFQKIQADLGDNGLYVVVSKEGGERQVSQRWAEDPEFESNEIRLKRLSAKDIQAEKLQALGHRYNFTPDGEEDRTLATLFQKLRPVIADD
jgi:hypothetical protein